MEQITRKQERRFFISIIVLLLVTCYSATSSLISKVYNLKSDKIEKTNEVRELKKDSINCNNWIDFLENAPDDIVIATVYHNTVEQTNSDNYHTASNFELDSLDQYQHRIIAVSRDLLTKYPLGSQVMVQGNHFYSGIWTVRDKMNKRYTDRIDFLINEDMQQGEWAVTLKLVK